MRTKSRIALSLPFAAILCLSPITLQAQELEPVPATAKQDSLLQTGMDLYDSGRYDEAIAIFDSILTMNPANVLALTELSLTYFAKEDYASTIKYAQEGLKYNSKYRAILYLHLGNGYDMLGKSAEAIAAYKKGLEARPGEYMLHYNLGLAYYRHSDLQNAREQLQAAMKVNPAHASSHLALGHVYDAMDKRIPAIFAFSRFLVLEPNSGRSPVAASLLRSLLSDSLSVKVTGPNQKTITVTPDSDGVDGNITPLAVALAMTQTTRTMEDTVHASALGTISADLTSFFRMLSELVDEDHEQGFCWEYYAPYFAEIQHKGFTDSFVRFIFQSLEQQGPTPPPGAGPGKEFMEWSRNYKWPD